MILFQTPSLDLSFSSGLVTFVHISSNMFQMLLNSPGFHSSMIVICDCFNDFIILLNYFEFVGIFHFWDSFIAHMPSTSEMNAEVMFVPKDPLPLTVIGSG